jgi:predicted RNase H-like nuclease (RuvC/YqgF family)
MSDEVKFNTVITEFENTISDLLEQVSEKDELISFNKFKINELTSRLKRSEGFSDNVENKNQIQKLNQKIASLRTQLSVSFIRVKYSLIVKLNLK